MYEIFRGEVAKVKQIRHLTNEDLGKMCGVAANTIAAFMCGSRVSDQLAQKLSKALNIEL